jgi:hypothetical protein
MKYQYNFSVGNRNQVDMLVQLKKTIKKQALGGGMKFLF